MSAQLFEKLQAPPDEPKFNSLTPEKLAELEAAFHQQENIKALRNAGVVVGSGVVLGFAVLGADGAYAQTAPGGGAASNAAANAKATIEARVTNAIDMIKAIDGLGLAAFGVALAPLGFMTTLRVLNMVLSRV
jgi:hypothetical protein